MAVSTIGTNSIADDAVTAAKVTGLGKIGQVDTTTFTGTESTTTNLSSADSYTTSSVAATLTPTATSSKIYVACTINAGSSDATKLNPYVCIVVPPVPSFILPLEFLFLLPAASPLNSAVVEPPLTAIKNLPI